MRVYVNVRHAYMASGLDLVASPYFNLPLAESWIGGHTEVQ